MEEDRRLVERTLQGDEKAFEMLIRKYQQPLWNYIGRMVQDRELALDLTQDILIKTYVSLSSYQPQYRFRTWLFKIASNHIIDHWRKKKIKALSSDRSPWEADDTPSFQVSSGEAPVGTQYEIAELKRQIEQALERVPVQLRELFLWRHVNGLSYQEIAEIKGLPVGTVKNRVFQGKELLRRLLEKKS
ncbi:MAG: RNA polymerase sigma factor [Candidatus Aminicenantales bacterium]